MPWFQAMFVDREVGVAEKIFVPFEGDDDRRRREASVRSVPECVRYDAHGLHMRDETVAAEIPVLLFCNGVCLNALSCTPVDLVDLAYGALFSAGVVDAASDIASVEIGGTADAPIVDVALREGLSASESAMRLSPLSGCPRSLCDQDVPSYFPARMVHVGPSRPFPATAITRAANALRDKQGMHQATGATHAAAFVSREGDFLMLREDVGRHNALDKLIGALLRAGADPQEGFVFLSSRCALELVSKAARFGVGLVATVSAPTSAVLEFAVQADVALAAFARDDRFTVYTHPERIVFDASCDCEPEGECVACRASA